MLPYLEYFDPSRAEYLQGIEYIYDVNPYDIEPNDFDLDDGPEMDFEHSDYEFDDEHSDVEPNDYDKESFFAPLSATYVYDNYAGVDLLRKFVDKIQHQICINEILSFSSLNEFHTQVKTKDLSCKVSLIQDSITIIDPELSWDIYFKNAMRRKAENLEPAPYFRLSVENFITIRRLRFNLIERIRKDTFIEQYELYQDNILIAAKYRDRSFSIISPKLFEECLRIPTESEIYRHFFFLYRTKQNFDTYNTPHLWEALSVSKAISPDIQVAIVPYKKELYREEITILDDLTQNEFWSAELLLLKDLVFKQETNKTNIFDSEAPWQQNFCVSVLMGEDKSGIDTVLEYLRNNLSIDEIGLTKQNAERFLKIVKCLDLAIKINNTRRAGQKVWFPNSCYELRTRILQLRFPHMKSSEAYTMTLHEGRMKDENYLLNENNWCPERRGLHHKIFVQHYFQSRISSHVIRVITGGTATGKSTLAPKGTWNPDEFKFFLKQKTKGINNHQIHEEGSVVFKRILKKALGAPGFQPDKQLAQLNFVLDKRMKKAQDLEEIVTAAKRRRVSVEINDLDGPLTTSLIRVLTRDPFGRDPCPTVEGIKEGFVEIRKTRLAINKKIQIEDVITKYFLLCFAKEEGSVKFKQKEVAKKENGKFLIIDNDLYKKLTQEPTRNEVEMELNTRITTEFIQEAVLRGDIREEDIGKIHQWLGLTLEEAVTLHSLGGGT